MDQSLNPPQLHQAWWIPALRTRKVTWDSSAIQARWTLEPDYGSVRIARELTRAILNEWGMARLGSDAELVVSELVTNALRHAAGVVRDKAVGDHAIELSILRRGPELVCAVRDMSDQLPAARDPDFMAESGRGLHLVACFSRGWGAEPMIPCGKFVWALFT